MRRLSSKAKNSCDGIDTGRDLGAQSSKTAEPDCQRIEKSENCLLCHSPAWQALLRMPHVIGSCGASEHYCVLPAVRMEPLPEAGSVPTPGPGLDSKPKNPYDVSCGSADPPAGAELATCQKSPLVRKQTLKKRPRCAPSPTRVLVLIVKSPDKLQLPGHSRGSTEAVKIAILGKGSSHSVP